MSEEPRLPKQDSNLEQLNLVATNDEGEAKFDASAVAPSIHASIELTEKNDDADEGDTGSFLAPLSKTSSFAGSFVDLGKGQDGGLPSRKSSSFSMGSSGRRPSSLANASASDITARLQVVGAGGARRGGGDGGYLRKLRWRTLFLFAH